MGASGLLVLLQSRGITLAASGDSLVVDHAGALTDADRDLIRTHKTALLAQLASPTKAAPEPVLTGCIPPEPIPDPCVWRDSVAWLPVAWRQKWGNRTEALQVAGKPWQEAEWQACREIVDQIQAAEAAGEVIELTEPAPSDDEAAIQAILGWPLNDRTSFAEILESGRKHNEAVLSRPTENEPDSKGPTSAPDSLEQLTLFK
jgi:hypothetical protein